MYIIHAPFYPEISVRKISCWKCMNITSARITLHIKYRLGRTCLDNGCKMNHFCFLQLNDVTKTIILDVVLLLLPVPMFRVWHFQGTASCCCCCNIRPLEGYKFLDYAEWSRAPDRNSMDSNIFVMAFSLPLFSFLRHGACVYWVEATTSRHKGV